MNNYCIDTRIGRLIHLYELGLLESEEHEEFEIHLLNCQFCYKHLTGFEETVDTLLTAPEIKEHVDLLMTDGIQQFNKQDECRVSSGVSFRAHITKLRITIAAAVILLVLLLQPWHFKVMYDNPAQASADRLAVFDFGEEGRNLSGKFGKILANLLVSDLSESRFLQVIPNQRINDLIEIIGSSERAGLDRNMINKVANRANAKWIVLGTVSSFGSSRTVTIQLLQVNNDSTMLIYQAGEFTAEETFTIVDELSQMIKNSLPLPEDAYREKDPSVAEITTHSADAYRMYMEGTEALSRLYYKEAVISFEKALSYDSTFAMAYYHLSLLKAPDLIYRASEFSRNATSKEKMYIQARKSFIDKDSQTYVDLLENIIKDYPDEKMAYYELGSYYLSQQDYNNAIFYLNKALEIYPRYKEAFNGLAYAWDGMGELDSAMNAINNYIQLAPDEPNPYDSRGEIYALNGLIDKSIESYKEAIRIKPDFWGASFKLGNLYVYKGDYEEAQYWYSRTYPLLNTSARTIKMFDFAGLLAHQGRFNEANDLFNREMNSYEEEVVRKEEFYRTRLRVVFLKALMLAESNTEKALFILQEFVGQSKGQILEEGISLDAFYAGLLAKSGRFAKADSIINTLDRSGTEFSSNFSLWFATGLKEYYKGNAADAADYLANITRSKGPRNDFIAHYYLAQALIFDNQAQLAVEILEKQLNIYGRHRILLPVLNVKIHYLLGLAYEQIGQYDLASKEYQTFLEKWQRADDDILVIHQVRERLANIIL